MKIRVRRKTTAAIVTLLFICLLPVTAQINSFPEYYKLAKKYYDEGMYHDALMAFDRAYAYRGKDHLYFYHKARCYDQLQNAPYTQYYYDMAIRFNPEKLVYYNQRAAYRLEKGNYEGAIEDFNQLIAHNEFDYNSYYGRGLAKYNSKNRTGACLDWLHAREQSKNCNRFFFYKCTDLDLRGKAITPVKNEEWLLPRFEYQADTIFQFYIQDKLPYPADKYITEEQFSIVAKFRLTANLQVEDIEIVYCTDTTMNGSVIQAIKQSEEYWRTPAYRNVKPADMVYYLPIRYVPSKNDLELEMYDLIAARTDFNDLSSDEQQLELVKAFSVNPFSVEVYSALNQESNTQRVASSEVNISWFKDFLTSDSRIMNEALVPAKLEKLYFNPLWQVSKPGHALYIRIIHQTYHDRSYLHGQFTDYHRKGYKVATGRYVFGQKQGEFRQYYPNGNLKKSLHYQDNQIVGEGSYYYPNGNVHQKIFFYGTDFQVVESYDSLGNNLLVDGSGMWAYQTRDYRDEMTIHIKGEIQNHRRTGIWTLHYDERLIAEEEYRNGKFYKGVIYDNGIKRKVKTASIESWILLPFSFYRAEKLEEEPVEKYYGKDLVYCD